jgi:hypothetical protein
VSKDIAPAVEGELLIYPAGEGEVGIRVLLAGESVWLTQLQMAELFQTSKQNIAKHLKSIFAERELAADSVVNHWLTTAADGKNYRVGYYNLDAILAVGYRVRSARGTEFRQWATARLSEYLVKGFVLDDERLKGNRSPVDYFDELLARIREIRASEARVYQRIREIFAMAVDYREGEQATQRFFAIMQNKMHYAACGLTAAEIVRQRADAAQPNMGLNAWKGSRVLKQDVGTAKNYLGTQEIDTLNRITVMFLDQAEFRAMRRQDIHLGDWDGFLDKFLGDTELPVLGSAGKVSHQQAQDWAERQYDAFAERRRLEAEQAAEARYLADLRSAAEAVKSSVKRKAPASKKPGKKRGSAAS